MKKTISVMLTLSMLLGTTVTADTLTTSENSPLPIMVTVDGEEVEFTDMYPCIVNDRVIVPMRGVFEKMGAEVIWSDTEYGQSVNVTRYYKKNGYDMRAQVGFAIGSNKMSRFYDEVIIASDSGKWETVELDVPAQIIGDRTYVPLRAVSEAFGCLVDWNEESYTIDIKTANTTPVEPDETYVSKLMSDMPADKNYVISPLSLKIAMMMAANGADNETKREMLKAFDITDLDEYNAKVKELIESLNTDEHCDVNIANSIWFNKDYYPNAKKADFSSSYKKTVAENYFASYGTVTDKNIVKTLNDWISKETNGKIKDMLTEENIAPTGKKPLLSLINAVYMKARWIYEFDKSDTKKDTFTDIDGKENSIDFMSQTSHFLYLDDGDTKIVELPYEYRLGMYVVLGDTKNIEDKFEQMANKKVHVSIPKFKTDYFVNLNETLQSMGVSKAFENDNPDFDSMVTGVPDPIKIETVLQKAIIDVDEEGTEAAAATFIGGAGGAAYRPDEEIFEFKADQPFTYYIRDNNTGEILFAGRYVKCD